MNARAERNRTQRKGIAKIRRSICSGGDFRANLETIGRENITLLAIAVLEKSNSGRPIWIVFDRHHVGDHSALAAFEIHLAILLLVTAADVARSQTTIIIPATGFLFRLGQALDRLELGYSAKSREGLEAQSWS